MDKHFNPEQIETKWSTRWEQSGALLPSFKGKPFCLMLPPPNVTGSLHLGHAFENAIMDILVRTHRMKGYNTLWQPGTDHAGIATQMVVERLCAEQGTSRHELGRDAFVKKIWEWKEQSGSTIMNQMHRLGSTPAWERERFTMDPGLCEAVQTVFIKLYEEGLIYRGKRLVNWDPKFCTAISDLEVVSEEEEGSLWTIEYPSADGKGSLCVATTRPETLFGDVAVAVHPEDARYTTFIGKFLKLPLTDRQIPVIADESIDPEFGTGCVKITPAHDFNDYATGQRHQLPMINIFTPTAHMNENVPSAYQGLERFEARKAVLKALEQSHQLIKTEKHTLKIPRGDRSGAVVEPYLTDQWYVKATELAGPALAAVQEGRINFVPAQWTNTYYEWMNNIQDWCISRQLWWGHRIPAWFDAHGKCYVGTSEAAIREQHGLDSSISLTQDEDVLDTWFSSALWPFSTLDWPKGSKELDAFYPTSVLVTGFDIIFFWVARMIMMGLKFMKDVPFKTVYIHGLILDPQGQKMSKSKGNVIDPMDVIDGISLDALLTKRTQGMMQPQKAEQIKTNTRQEFPEGIPAFGIDPLRFTFCALATQGRFIRFDLQRVEGYRNFCNKLWNAARYVFMHIENQPISYENTPSSTVLNQWIAHQLNETVKQAHQHVDEYRFDLLANSLYDFSWNVFCDWYLELTKPFLFSDDETTKASVRGQLVKTLDTLCRLLHPIMPFITEEIWEALQAITNKEAANAPTLLLTAAYPEIDHTMHYADANNAIEWIQGVVTGTRLIRSQMSLAPSMKFPVLLKGSEQDKTYSIQYAEILCSLAKLKSVEWLEASTTPPPSAQELVKGLQILVPLEGIIDKDQEIIRLNKALEKVNKDIDFVNGKLLNEAYCAKAPAAVVEKEREKMREFEATRTSLLEQLDKMAAL